MQTHLTLVHPGYATPRLMHSGSFLAQPQLFHFGTACLSYLTLLIFGQASSHLDFLTAHSRLHRYAKVVPPQKTHFPPVRRLLLCCMQLPGHSFSFRIHIVPVPSHTHINNSTSLDTHTTTHSSSLPIHHLAPSFTLFTGGREGSIVVNNTSGLCVLSI